MPSPAVQQHAKKNRHRRQRQRSVFSNSPGYSVDQGVDFTGIGNIPALAPATITDVGTVHIIEGATLPYVIYRVNHGKHKGQYIYVMETFTPKVKVGDTVAAGQSIGYATGGGYGIEIGFNKGPKGVNPIAPLYPNPHSPKDAGYRMLAWLKNLGLATGTIPSTGAKPDKPPPLADVIGAVKSDLAQFKNDDGTYGKNHKTARAIARLILRLRKKVIAGKLTVDQADAQIAKFAGTPVTVKSGSALDSVGDGIWNATKHVPGVQQAVDVYHGIGSVVDFLELLANPTTWLRGVYIVGGGFLMVGGIYIVAKELGAPNPAAPVIKTAAKAAEVAALIPK